MAKREQFGQALREARQRAGFRTIADFAASLQRAGIPYSDSAVQSWETGQRVSPREVLLDLSLLLEGQRAFEHRGQVERLLAGAGYSALTENEFQDLFPRLLKRDERSPMLPPRPDYRRLVGRDAVLQEVAAALNDPLVKPAAAIAASEVCHIPLCSPLAVLMRVMTIRATGTVS